MKRSLRAIRSWREISLPTSRSVRGSGSWLAWRSWRGPADWRGSGVIAVAAPRGRRRRGALPRRVKLGIVLLLGLSLLLGGGWLWLRTSSLVAVQQVTVTGEKGPEAGAIRVALRSAARSMTTLDVDIAHLYAAVSAYPVVQALEVTTQFPHGMRIHVIERVPVALVVLAGQRQAVSADGTLLPRLAAVHGLPLLALSVLPGGPRLSDPQSLQELAVAAAAPKAMRARITLIRLIAGQGLVVTLRRGPALYLGSATNLRAKWDAAVTVLADPGSTGASYIDVSDPGRPAAGGPGGDLAGSAGAGDGSSEGSTPPPSVTGSAWAAG